MGNTVDLVVMWTAIAMSSSPLAVAQPDAMRSWKMHVAQSSFGTRPFLRRQVSKVYRTAVRPCASSLSDMSDEALEKALQYQQRQAQEKPKPRLVEPSHTEIQRDEEKSPESKRVQDDLADRLGDLAEEQAQQAIQRQVGATRADWTDATDPDVPVEEPTSSEPVKSPEEAETSSPSKNKKSPVKRFPDGSVLYTAEQFE